MPATLYVVHGSHPCATAARALDLKVQDGRAAASRARGDHARPLRAAHGARHPLRGRREGSPARARSCAASTSASKSRLKAAIPLVGRIELRLNAASDAARAADLQALGGWLQRVDDWLADGTLGAEPPNAADLQIAPSLKLLMAMDDLRAIIAPRPRGAWADRLFPATVGHLPPGAIPAEVLPVGA